MRVRYRTYGNSEKIQQTALLRGPLSLRQKDREKSPSANGGMQPLLHLQRHNGNRHVQRVLAAAGEKPISQTKNLRGGIAAGKLIVIGNPAFLTVQRDLARRPRGRKAKPPVLSEQQINNAISYNHSRFRTRNIRRIQDIVGAPVTGTMDAETIHMITEWQADHRLKKIDGKVGLRTLRSIAREMIREGYRNSVIWLIIDGYNFLTRGLINIRYDPNYKAANAETRARTVPGRSRVVVGPKGFARGYAGLVHTIAHELLHVRQFLAGMRNLPTIEFLAERLEIMSRGMFWEGLGGFMSDAWRALRNWYRMPPTAKKKYWAQFRQVRRRVIYRYKRASARRRRRHGWLMGLYHMVIRPR